MPARNELFVSGYYHVYNRGHNKQIIFRQDKDYRRYITRLKEYLGLHDVELIAYCLMPNHIHLLLHQTSDESLALFMHRLHTAYTMYFNLKYNMIGSVFQGRFKAKFIESDEYLIHVSRYIHLNPLTIIRAQGPALKLENYTWSSYRQYIEPSTPSLCQTKDIIEYFPTKATGYKEFVESQMELFPNTELEAINNGQFPEEM
jgi:REP element-mobilizing transposase RayT